MADLSDSRSESSTSSSESRSEYSLHDSTSDENKESTGERRITLEAYYAAFYDHNNTI